MTCESNLPLAKDRAVPKEILTRLEEPRPFRTPETQEAIDVYREICAMDLLGAAI